MRTTWLSFALVLGGCFETQGRIVEEREASVEVAGHVRASIDVGDGDLEVIGEPDLTTFEVDAILRGGVASYDDDEAMERWAIELDRGEEGISLRVDTSDLPAGYYVDVRVRMPSALSLSLVDGSGDTVVSDVASLIAEDDSGELEIDRVEGSVEITDDSGEIEVRDVGALTIEDSSGGIAIVGVDGAVRVNDDDGDLSVEAVSGDVDLVDGSGEIYVDDVSGTVTIDDGSGGIEVGAVGALEVRSDESGEVHRF